MFIQRVKASLFVKKELRVICKQLDLKPIPFLIGELGCEVFFIPDSSYCTKKGGPILAVSECLMEAEEREPLREALAKAVREYWQFTFMHSEYSMEILGKHLGQEYLVHAGLRRGYSFTALDSKSWAHWYVSNKKEDYKMVSMDRELWALAGGEYLDKEKLAQLVLDRYSEFK